MYIVDFYYILCGILDWIWVSNKYELILVNMNGKICYYWEDMFLEMVWNGSGKYIVNSDN